MEWIFFVHFTFKQSQQPTVQVTDSSLISATDTIHLSGKSEKFSTLSLRSAKADIPGLSETPLIFPPLQMGEVQFQETDMLEGGFLLLCDVWQMNYHLNCGNSVIFKGYEQLIHEANRGETERTKGLIKMHFEGDFDLKLCIFLESHCHEGQNKFLIFF